VGGHLGVEKSFTINVGGDNSLTGVITASIAGRWKNRLFTGTLHAARITERN
jgi:hypothetical protein